MKKLFLSLIFFLVIAKATAQITTQTATTSQAQIIVDPPPPQDTSTTIQITEELPNWTFILANLNTTQITSGVLIDKITSFTNLINYNTTEKNISNNEHFTQALSELYRGSDLTRFISLSELKIRTATTTASNSVDIGILNTTFQKLNYNEDVPSSGGLLFQNEQFVTIPNKPSFISKKIVVASPLKDMVTGSSINFNFKTNLILNNATTNIKTLVVNFDGTNSTTIISNGVITIPTKTVNFTTSGAKTLQFTTTFTDNTTITTYGYVYLNYVSNVASAVNTTNSLCDEITRAKGTFQSLISFQGYTETAPIFGKTEYTIFYSVGNTAKQMIKPIIIVDGFDPKDKRKVQDCDCENDTTPAPNNCKLNNSDIVITWNGFIPTINIVFNPTKHESIYDSMEYQGFNPITELPEGQNLLEQLRLKGYDVIVINNPTYTTPQGVVVDGGADYIERNALTLVSFIKNYLKPQQALAGSTQPLVLIGPSMGGQITRYALAYMEKQFAQTGLIEWKHNARLWVSVDSPHLGANIPVGAQANIWFMAEKLNKEKAKIQYNEELNSVAGKQQIILQLKNAQENGGTLSNSPFFTTYYNNLNTNGVAGSKGYPVSTPTFRKIAMVNGSLSGLKQGTEGNTFLYTRIYIRGLWPFQSSTITLARFRDSFLPSSGSTGQVFQGDGQNFNIGFNHWTINHPQYTLNVTNNNVRGSLDVVPGGSFKTAKYLKEAIEAGASEGGYRSETTNYTDRNSFISSFSALGHLQPNQNWSNPLNTNLVCASNKKTPFDSYYGEESNSEHTTFTNEGANWLFNELDSVPQLPSYPIDQSALSGPTSICVGQTATYSFADLCKLPSTFTWNVEYYGGSILVSNQTASSITLTGQASGIYTIVATFLNGKTIRKEVRVGGPLTYNQMCYSQYMEPCFGSPNFVYNSNSQNYSMTLSSSDEAVDPYMAFNWANWQWEKISGTFNFVSGYDPVYGPSSGNGTTASGKVAFFQFTNGSSPSTNSFTFRARSKNTNASGCGWGDWKTFTNVGYGNRLSAPQNFYKIYPNPTNNIVNVSLIDETAKPVTTSKIVAELYDMMGQPRRNAEVINNIASVDVSGLPRGIYLLKINIDGVIESHQVAVQ